MTATMTSSKCRAVRSMMSRWPLVTGSNEPGQRAVATQAPVRSGCRTERSRKTTSVSPNVRSQRARQPSGSSRPRRRSGRSTHDRRVRREQPGRRRARRATAATSSSARVVGRVGEHQVERRLARAAAAARNAADVAAHDPRLVGEAERRRGSAAIAASAARGRARRAPRASAPRDSASMPSAPVPA